MDTIDRTWITTRREMRYRRTPELRVQTPDEALAFVNDVGFCHFWPIKGIETPNLFHAIAGRVRAVPNEHADPDISKCWGWKDQALGKRIWYYGKLLRRRATLASLDLLPAFYACTENYGDLEDYLEEYRSGTMTAEARRIYEAILESGPLDTVRLRRESRMAAESAKARFERALVELQIGLKVLPIGVAEAGAWRYAFIYEIVQRHYPDLPEVARRIVQSEARRTLVRQYVDNVIAVEQGMIRKVFHVLNWAPAELDRTIQALIDEGAIRWVRIKGEDQPQLLSLRALEAIRE
ncbi:MAG: hypothetical protein ISS56_06550 [Anaerolineae bacterium]|nr:hypothetical protein [Anaerolineae bacterium]